MGGGNHFKDTDQIIMFVKYDLVERYFNYKLMSPENTSIGIVKLADGDALSCSSLTLKT